MRPLSVQVITYAPTVFRHCQHCEVAFAGVGFAERMHRNEAKDALPDDLLAEYQQVSDWVHGLLERHGSEVDISVIDAASIQGVWQSLRHRARRYPAVIVEGAEPRSGTDFSTLDALVDERMRQRSGEGRGTPSD